MNPQAYVFDAYGTLFDVHSVVLRAGQGIPADLQALSRLWRQKQLDYTWLRSLMGRYEDFWRVTEDALRSAISDLKIHSTEAQIGTMMDASVPLRIRRRGTSFRKAEGEATGHPVQRLAKNAGRGGRPQCSDFHFAEVISVNRLKTYKPSPRVYALGTETLNLPASEILFVSSNSWDVAGAKAFGYKVCWCNRSAAEMEHLGLTPDAVVARLSEIPGIL